MKTRNDFVSNSSSCSFVIKDVQTLVKLFKNLFKDIDIPYEFDNNITCRIYAQRKNWSSVYENIMDEPADANKSFIGVTKCDDVCFYDPIYSNFAKVAALPDNIITASEIEFECEDHGSGPMHLKMLYDFFKHAGLNPDAEDSEHDFLEDNDIAFYKILKNYRCKR